MKLLGLSPAEIRVARLVVQGGTNPEIARTLGISVHTVRHHVQHIHDVGPFSYNGTFTFNVNAGDAYGFQFGGAN